MPPADLAHRSSAELRPDPSRVTAQLFLAGEDLPRGRSRADEVAARVLALSEPEVQRLASELARDFGRRHLHYAEILDEHATIAESHLPSTDPMSEARRMVLGASFTSEYAVEAAALCNPSAVPHPDQSGLLPGQLRVALSLRGIGEGHISSIEFATAVIGPGADWVFQPRKSPIVRGSSTQAHWSRDYLREVLTAQCALGGLAHSVLATLPETFTADDLDTALTHTHHSLRDRPGSAATITLLRRTVTSVYEVDFPAEVELSQQVLLPSTDEESHGMEDARFVRFTTDEGMVEYRATYTAYDGQNIKPRLLTSTDLRGYCVHRLTGPAALGKGMALFPRLVGGQHLALCRFDDETNSITSSNDGLVWRQPTLIQSPEASWELVKIGNCGSPIETDAGWLVLTHGVGPMRAYGIGAILLDIDDPTRVLAKLEQPLLRANPDEREGYVPNVVYSCGAVAHEGRVWLPYGVGDARIRVAWASIDELISAMTPVKI